MSKVKTVVHKESTLGYMLPNGHMQALHASVLRGSTFDRLAGSVVVNQKDIRSATHQDFDDFRVLWHPNYEVAS